LIGVVAVFSGFSAVWLKFMFYWDTTPRHQVTGSRRSAIT